MIKEYTPASVEQALQYIRDILPGQTLTLILSSDLLDEVVNRIQNSRGISPTKSLGKLTVSRDTN